jgi:hypothetical protein
MIDPRATALSTAIAAVTGGSESSSATTATLDSARVPVSALDRSCGEHKANADAWFDLAILSGPSTEVRKQAARFLVRKPKELEEIYTARVQGFTYTNIIGNGLGWYVAKLFKDDVDIDVKVAGETIDLAEDEAHEYYARFLADCDRAGTTFTKAMQEVFRQLCVMRACYVLIDLPTDVSDAESAADQRIEPYICLFDPACAINMERDKYGNLKWIVFRTEAQDTPFLGAPVTVRRWSYYDATEYRIYEHRSTDSQLPGETEQMATLVGEGRHALADHDNQDGTYGRVPVVDAQANEILWLGARVYLQALDHLNTENTLKWGLFLGNLAQPVIKTDGEYKPTAHEAGAIVLAPGDEYSFAEPSGKTFEISQGRLDRLREDMYRSMYLQAQGRSESATPAAQSGVSKEQDMAPGRDVLNSFGAIMRETMLKVLYLIASIRQDTLTDFEARGLQHNDDPITADITDATQVRALAIQSDRFDKEVQKQVVRRFGRNWQDDTIEEICAEIDKAPGKSEVDQAQADREDEQMSSKMSSAFKLVPDDSAADTKDNEE